MPGLPGAGISSNPWWTYSRVDGYGSPDPFGGFPKPDSNIQYPAGAPVAALLPGTVSGINAPNGSVPPYGAVVTIKLDQPLNKLATHTAYLHLSRPYNVKVGQHVSAGDLIGFNGGINAAGSQKVPLGFALTSTDYYGYGAGWKQNLGNANLDPTGLLGAAQSGNLNNYLQGLKLNPVNLTGQSGSQQPGSIGGAATAVSSWLAPLQSIGVSWGEHIAIFLIALLMIALGLYLIAEKQVNQVAGAAVKAVAA